MPRLTKKMREKVRERRGGKCVYCGREMSPGEMCYIDRVVPEGGDDERNLEPACRGCYYEKRRMKAPIPGTHENLAAGKLALPLGVEKLWKPLLRHAIYADTTPEHSFYYHTWTEDSLRRVVMADGDFDKVPVSYRPHQTNKGDTP